MIDWLKRQALINRGLSCERTRRQLDTADSILFCRKSPWMRAFIFAAAAFALVRVGMWKSSVPWHETLMMTLLILMAGVFLFLLIAKEVWKDNKLLTLTMVCLVLNVLIDKALFILFDNPFLFETRIPDLFVPAALGPILITILISPSTGILLVLLVAFSNTLFLDADIKTLASSVVTGFAGVYFTRNVRKRSHLLWAGAALGAVGMLCALCIGGMRYLSMNVLAYQTVWALILGLITVFVVGAILPVLEWVFDRVTDISWVEYTDLNHPLLKRLTMEAPGTYHHSLMVGNLAEAAAEAIGANPTMCRVLAYFHDIGKLTKPEYFIENVATGRNPHTELSPTMSALIIISHVKEGVDLALQYALPRPIVDCIQQHHGTSLVYYFYRKALQQHEDAKAGSEILKLKVQELPPVDESSFQYPGPIAQFKECALVSLADAIESSSRNLRNPTLQSIENLVKDMIRKRIEDRQLDDSGLKLEEIRMAEERFIFTLKNMLHARIEYPKGTNEEESSEENRPAQSPKAAPSESFQAAKVRG